MRAVWYHLGYAWWRFTVWARLRPRPVYQTTHIPMHVLWRIMQARVRLSFEAVTDEWGDFFDGDSEKWASREVTIPIDTMRPA